MVTSYCTLGTVAFKFCISIKGWAGGAGWIYSQGAVTVHMMATRFGCKRTMVDTRWTKSCPGGMNGLRKYYSHLVGCSFLAGIKGFLGSEWVFG